MNRLQSATFQTQTDTKKKMSVLKQNSSDQPKNVVNQSGQLKKNELYSSTKKDNDEVKITAYGANDETE